MPPSSAPPSRRPFVVGVTNCHDAKPFARLVHLDRDEEAHLRDALGRLYEFGLLLPAALQAADEAIDLAGLIRDLGTAVGAPFVGAALRPGEPFTATDPLPVAAMPVWGFEPEADSDDVLVSSARLWGADLLIEALLVDSEEEGGVAPAVRERFARWAAAAGWPRFLPVLIPGRAGCYALFANMTPD